MTFPFLLFCVAGPLLPRVQTPQAPAKVTLLRVEGHAFGEKQTFTVTGDSVLVDKALSTEKGDHRTHYARALTRQQHDEVLASFNHVYLSSLKSCYEDPNALTDDLTFTLFIHKGEAGKHIQIYRYKLVPFFCFSTKLNQLLPYAFQLGYNKSYFTN
jgi:hypothetical protein